MKKTKFIGNSVVFLSLVLMMTACDSEPQKKPVPAAPATSQKKTASIEYSVVARYPHDTTAYTEGFLFHDGKLFESTGGPEYLKQTRSAVGIVDLKTGKFDTKIEIDKRVYFGEGILILNNKLYQLTYQNQIGFIYDLKTFNRIGQFGYLNKEGWGMTTDGKHMIFSDGTSVLTYMNPEDFKVVKTLEVVENGYALQALNELECINGFIYANVWMTNRIVKINPANGEVVGELDLAKLYYESKLRNKNINELNGIAYDSISGKILVTGKLWPDIYEISFAK